MTFLFSLIRVCCSFCLDWNGFFFHRYLLSWLLHPCLPRESGHTQVPVYSSKCSPAVHLTSMASPSMQLQKMLQTAASGWAKKPLRRGHTSVGFGGSVAKQRNIIVTYTRYVYSIIVSTILNEYARSVISRENWTSLTQQPQPIYKIRVYDGEHEQVEIAAHLMGN